jgi:filamentous hemagglutinin family protein
MYLNSPESIQRIITRVTGGNASKILDTLRVLGNSDLIFINPSGIFF